MSPWGVLRELDQAVEEVMEDKVLSQAVITYLGKGRSPFPRSDEDAVRSLASETGVDADALLGSVVSLVDECLAVEIDWSSSTLSEGGDEAERITAARHPELGADALTALRWAFTYNGR